jgi:hypothetical protein
MTAHLFLKAYYMPLILKPVSFARGLRCVFGDESIFVRARAFWEIGGYDDKLAIMEDADLTMRLHHSACKGSVWKVCCCSPICHLPGSVDVLMKNMCLPPVFDARLKLCVQAARIQHVLYRGNETSGRRMVAWGPWKTTRIHFHIGMLWFFGCSPEKLQATYDSMYGNIRE